MRHIRYIIFVILLSSFAFCLRLHAQQYDFKNFQVNDGLSSNTVTSLLQDREGYVWIGTRSGLNRYDGRHFKIFRNQPGVPFSLGDNAVLCLFEDHDRHIWVGTYTGIYVFYPESEKFVLRKDLPTSEIRFIKSTPDGYIWIGTHNELFRYHAGSKQLSYILLPQGETLICNSQAEDPHFWLGRGNRHVLKYNTATHRFLQYDLPARVGNKPLSNIQDIASIGDSALLIGSMTSVLQLNVYSRKTAEVTTGRNQKVQIHAIVRRNATEYWLGTEDGILRYNVPQHTSSWLLRQSSNPYALTDNVIYTLKKDRENGIWIGTFFGGLNYYSPKWNFFHKYFPNSPHSPLSGHIVHEITEDSTGNIWIGTEDGGLDKLNGKDGSIQFFQPSSQKGSISYNNIHGLAAMGNELWIGTYEHGLDVMDIPSGKIIRHYHKDNKDGSLDGDFIVAMYRGQGHKMYVGTWNSLFQYEPRQDRFRKIPYFNAQVQSITQEKDGTLWIASYGKGLYYWNENNGKHGHLSATGAGKTAIPSNYVNNITIDHTGQIWAATENGLFVYDHKRRKVETFNERYGFAHGQVFKVVQDDYQRFWISTSNGLYCYDPADSTQKQYTMAYGLPSQQFNYNSGFKDSNGNLYFGTVNGMVSFRPSRMLDNDYEPPVYVTGLKINNVVSDSLLTNANIHTNTAQVPVQLNHNQSSISFDVSALTYALPGTTTLLYKLEDFDKDWNVVSNTGNVFYPKLSPGKYIFRIKNAHHTYPFSEAAFPFTIRPPIWASVGAYILYALAIFCIVFLLLRYYFLALKEKQQRILVAFENDKQKEIYASKIDFFTHVAHEIRTPLTLIKLPLEKLKHKQSLDEQSLQNIILMEKNTNRLIDLTNELLDFRKAESNNYRLNFTDVDITRLLQKTVETLRPLAEQKQLHLLVDTPRLHLIANVDAEAMNKILTNLINNAIKYGNKQVNVVLEPFGSDDTQFCIRISNDGLLIPKDQKEKIFEPFARLKEAEKETGTGIGLPLSRALTQLHNGTLDLDVSTGINIFILKVPIEQTGTIHLNETPRQPAHETLTGAAFPIDAAKATLLLAEDNMDILSFVSKELQEDYNILMAQNGQQALEVLDKTSVDLVITDIMMPVMDGMELCKRIKEDVRFSHIPVLMLTAKNTLASKIEGLETGADAYIEKPFAMDYLRAQVKSILQNRQIIQKHFAASPLAHIKSIGATNKDKEFLETLQNLINAHITEEDLDVKELATMLNMSKPTLYRKIKAISNLSPNELINITRLKRAAELLAEGKYRISEVAVMTGYSLQGNFSRDFNKQFGLTPSQFMENLKKTNNH